MEGDGAMALKAVTRQRLVKTQQTEKTLHAVVYCQVCELVLALYLHAVTICKGSINSITNPNPVYNHPYMQHTSSYYNVSNVTEQETQK
jgi:ABC-type Fe3+/spermidine/putrescine transport system ATPase subunit